MKAKRRIVEMINILNIFLYLLFYWSIYEVSMWSIDQIDKTIAKVQSSVYINKDVFYRIPPIHTRVAYYTLTMPDGIEVFNLEAIRNLKMYPTAPYLNILIDSKGGFLNYGVTVANIFRYQQSHGVKIRCYVSYAASAAFYIMTFCDERIGLKGGKLMTHWAQGQGETSNFSATFSMAKEEAANLGYSHQQWMRLSRPAGQDFNRYWSMEEALKYKLIDRIQE